MTCSPLLYYARMPRESWTHLNNITLTSDSW